MEDYYRSNNIYLDAIAMDASCELVIMMTNSDASQEGFNFNLYDDSELMELEASIRVGYVKMGIEVTGFSTYQSATAKFIVMDTTAQTSDGESMCRRQFYTVYNGQAIHITLNYYTIELTPELESELQSVVDSVVFSQTLPTPEDALALQSGNIFASYIWVWIRGAAISAIIGLVIYLARKKAKKKSTITSNNNDI